MAPAWQRMHARCAWPARSHQPHVCTHGAHQWVARGHPAARRRDAGTHGRRATTPMRQPVAPGRTATVDDRQMPVFAALIAPQEAARYLVTIAHAAFARTAVAHPHTPEHRHWVCEMP